MDLHVHGFRGCDAQSHNPREILRLAKLLGREGLAGFLLTYVSAPRESLLRSLRAAREAFQRQSSDQGARLLGVHLEGPFLNPERRGAHPLSALRTPSLPETRSWLDVAGPLLKIVTLAPELPGAESVVRFLTGQGVRVQMGHSSATETRARTALRWGVSGVTHLFNAMGASNRKNPGLAGMALHQESLFTELIGDGAHVSDDLFRLTLRIRPLARLILVSDTCAASGYSPGRRASFAGGAVTTAPDGSIRRKDGVLAASGLSLPRAVHRLIQNGLLHENQAQLLARANPLSYLNPRVPSSWL